MCERHVRYTEMTSLTAHNKCSIIPQSASVHFACNSCAKIACSSCEVILMFLYADGSIQNASEQFVSCIHLSFVNFADHPTAQTEI